MLSRCCLEENAGLYAINLSIVPPPNRSAWKTSFPYEEADDDLIWGKRWAKWGTLVLCLLVFRCRICSHVWKLHVQLFIHMSAVAFVLVVALKSLWVCVHCSHVCACVHVRRHRVFACAKAFLCVHMCVILRLRTYSVGSDPAIVDFTF